MTDQTEQMIAYRMEKAEEALEAARILLREKSYTAAVNRIYYAVFYSASSVLLTKGHSSSKHSGVVSLFGEQIVNKGLANKEFGRFYNRMFRHRHKGDYQDFVQFDPQEIELWIGQAVKFIEMARDLISKASSPSPSQ
jgi:uncharacterized protein (UPF0332 family)